MGQDIILQDGIDKLRDAQAQRRNNIKELKLGIRSLRQEQRELRLLLDGDHEYDTDALVANIERINGHIKLVDDAVAKEEQGISELQTMVEELERRKNDYQERHNG